MCVTFCPLRSTYKCSLQWVFGLVQVLWVLAHHPHCTPTETAPWTSTCCPEKAQIFWGESTKRQGWKSAWYLVWSVWATGTSAFRQGAADQFFSYVMETGLPWLSLVRGRSISSQCETSSSVKTGISFSAAVAIKGQSQLSQGQWIVVSDHHGPQVSTCMVPTIP